jgi:hypothetical protein
MEQTTEEKQLKAFSRTAIFFVTGASFFLFSFFLRLLEGNHSRFFMIISITTVVLGACNWMLTRPMKSMSPHEMQQPE